MFEATQRVRRPLLTLAASGLLCAVAVTSIVASRPAETEAAAEPRTKVILNGKPVPVFFNDGDSFRVLGGEYQGAKARLAGYNTLESYGPVHQWGDWTEKELYTVAKMATLWARKRVWECESDGKTDTYGRMLVWCPELAREQIRLGHAHAMSINDDPGKPELLEAQREAIAARRGIWAHGVPEYILTSLHSAEEDTEGHGTYNRLVSSVDAHSVKWKHDNKYPECTKVCHMIWEVQEDKVAEVAEALKGEAGFSDVISPLSADELTAMVTEFAKYQHIDRSIPGERREALKTFLLGWVAEGRFGEQQGTPGACMTHVDFKRRFGGGKAQCLK